MSEPVRRPWDAIETARTAFGSIETGWSDVGTIGEDALSLDPVVVGVILAMTLVTVATKVGGLWILSRVEPSDRLQAGLSVLPGAIVIAVLGPELAAAGPAEWGAAAAVLVIAWRTESILLSLCGGVVAVVLLRTIV